ncbi:MAG: hypothetical protein R3E18_02425 [Sphingomonadaceae bacterium]|nr:hypothetical protein [Sphingomonadaceae bacterium]
MTQYFSPRRLAIGAMAAMGAVLLSGCMILPGKFVSELMIMKDGRFSYSYQGDIHILSMSKLAQMGSQMEGGEFTPDSCYDEETYADRECTAEELAQQKADYDERMAGKAERDAKEAEQMQAMFGGVDPSDPASADELAKRIERQAGFRSVTHKGDGLFEVDYRIEGVLSYDFVFPTFERFPMTSYFVMAGRRDDGAVRIDAPGFAPAAGNPMQGMMGGMNRAGGNDAKMPPMPVIDGSFAIVTNGDLLANNTDEGAVIDGNGLKRLEWKIDQSTTAAPTALIQLDR